jgi:hypothetical protein
LNTIKKIIYGALASGNSFFANDYLSNSKGFRFYAEAGKKKYQMGETLEYAGKIKLNVVVPSQKSEIKLIHNGILIETEEGDGAKFVIKEPGVYRVEILHNKKSWIYSNHIRINI